MIYYKGFGIEPRPGCLASGNYTLNVTVFRFESHQVTSYPFSTNNEFREKATAVWHCLRFAMLVIEGQVSNCSVIG